MQTFGEVAYKYFNVHDNVTLEALTGITEEEQSKILSNLTTKLYNAIMDKVDDIDYGNIPATRGDITRLENYEDLVDCTNIIKDIVEYYHQDPSIIQTVIDAINNIKDRTSLFEKIFATNLEFGITIYNTMVLSCVSAISFLISTSIDFIRHTDSTDKFDISLDRVGYKKSKDYLLLKNLRHFNSSCSNGNIDKALNQLLDTNRKNFVGELSVPVMIIISITIITSIIPFIRELIYFFYYARQSISDYFAIQADLLQMNASNLDNTMDADAEDIKRTYEKQNRIADKFRKISNFMSVKLKKSEAEAEKNINADEKKYDIDDVSDSFDGDLSAYL